MNEELKKMIDESPIIPVFTRILLKVEEVEKKSDGGILIPDSCAEKMNRQTSVGIILGIGDACFFEFADGNKNGSNNINIKVGDRVTFAKHSGEHCKYNDNIYRLINDTDITGIVKDGVKL